jgi:hypothetical protein
VTEPLYMVKGQGLLFSFHDLPLSTCLLVNPLSPSISATTLGESELSPNGRDRLSFVGVLICASISVHVAIEVVGVGTIDSGPPGQSSPPIPFYPNVIGIRH